MAMVCAWGDNLRPERPFVPIAWSEAKRRARFRVSRQIRECGPKVQRFKGKFNLIRSRWYQDRDWLPTDVLFSSKLCNCKGACPGF